VLVTSGSAVPAAAALLPRLCGRPAFAVGDRTAAALAAAGYGQVVSAAGDGAALARAVASTLPRGSRLLHLAGRDRRPEPGRSLREQGFSVETATVYAAEPITGLPEEARDALRTGSLDAALHYSSRSAVLLLERVAEAGLTEALRRLAHPCLSPEVARVVATGLPGARTITAAAPDEPSLILALAEAALRGDFEPAGRPLAPAGARML